LAENTERRQLGDGVDDHVAFARTIGSVTAFTVVGAVDAEVGAVDFRGHGLVGRVFGGGGHVGDGTGTAGKAVLEGEIAKGVGMDTDDIVVLGNNLDDIGAIIQLTVLSDFGKTDGKGAVVYGRRVCTIKGKVSGHFRRKKEIKKKNIKFIISSYFFSERQININIIF